MPSSASVRNICARDAGVRAHADADDATPWRCCSSPDALRAHLMCGCTLSFRIFERLRVVVAVHGEGEVGHAVVADVLHDHVDVDVGVGDRARGSGRRCPGGRARPCTVILASSRLNAMPEMTGLFHLVVFLECDQRARLGFLVDRHVRVGEARQHAQSAPGTCRRTRPSGSAAPWSPGSPSRAFPRR